MFKRINYKDLKPRQKENYNFQKVAATLADYGYNCMRLSDDWEGADFIACHIDGNTFLKVQLKGRLTFMKKYINKNIYIAFREKGECYIYPHDEVLKEKGLKLIKDSDSWTSPRGAYSWPRMTKELKEHMTQYAR